jgi:hypothetical protein
MGDIFQNISSSFASRSRSYFRIDSRNLYALLNLLLRLWILLSFLGIIMNLFPEYLNGAGSTFVDLLLISRYYVREGVGDCAFLSLRERLVLRNERACSDQD